MRPAFDIAQIAMLYEEVKTELKMSLRGLSTSGTPIWDTLALAAVYGDWLTIEITGKYADHLLYDLKLAFEKFCQYEKQPLVVPEHKYDIEAIKRDFAIYGYPK